MMKLGFSIPIGGTGRSTQSSWIAVLITGVTMVGGGISAIGISISMYNPDPTDFFYDIDNESSTVFAVVGIVSLIIGLVLVVLSFKVKNDERMRLENQARAEEEARQRNIREIA